MKPLSATEIELQYFADGLATADRSKPQHDAASVFDVEMRRKAGIYVWMACQMMCSREGMIRKASTKALRGELAHTIPQELDRMLHLLSVHSDRDSSQLSDCQVLDVHIQSGATLGNVPCSGLRQLRCPDA